MKPEEINKNHFRDIAIEQLQWELSLLEGAGIPNSKEARQGAIKRFLEEYKNNELVNLNSIEEVEEELAKLKSRLKEAIAKDDDYER